MDSAGEGVPAICERFSQPVGHEAVQRAFALLRVCPRLVEFCLCHRAARTTQHREQAPAALPVGAVVALPAYPVSGGGEAGDPP